MQTYKSIGFQPWLFLSLLFCFLISGTIKSVLQSNKLIFGILMSVLQSNKFEYSNISWVQCTRMMHLAQEENMDADVILQKGIGIERGQDPRYISLHPFSCMHQKLPSQWNAIQKSWIIGQITLFPSWTGIISKCSYLRFFLRYLIWCHILNSHGSCLVFVPDIVKLNSTELGIKFISTFRNFNSKYSSLFVFNS